MSILIDENTKLLIQGVGKDGSFQALRMLEYGTNIVAGVTPGKGGLKAVNDRVPVFNSVKEAKKQTEATASIIFVPPAFAAEAILESVYAGIKVIVCITSVQITASIPPIIVYRPTTIPDNKILCNIDKLVTSCTINDNKYNMMLIRTS